MTLPPALGFPLVISYTKEVEKMQESNNIRESVFAFDQAIRLKPDYAEAYYNRGVAKSRLGEYEAALADYDRGDSS